MCHNELQELSETECLDTEGGDVIVIICSDPLVSLVAPNPVVQPLLPQLY